MMDFAQELRKRLPTDYPSFHVTQSINFDGYRVDIPGKEPIYISALQLIGKNTYEAVLDTLANKLSNGA